MTDTSPRTPVPDGLSFERPLLELEQKIQELRNLATGTHLDLVGEIESLKERLARQTEEVYAQLSPWERVNVARHAERPEREGVEHELRVDALDGIQQTIGDQQRKHDIRNTASTLRPHIVDR